MNIDVAVDDLRQRLDKLERELEGKTLRLMWLEEQLRQADARFNAFVRATDQEFLSHRNFLDELRSAARREHG